jgi:hypothetical protein
MLAEGQRRSNDRVRHIDPYRGIPQVDAARDQRSPLGQRRPEGLVRTQPGHTITSQDQDRQLTAAMHQMDCLAIEARQNMRAIVEVGTERLSSCVQLMTNPVQLYQQAADETRRQLNETFYRRLYLDDVPPMVRVIRDELIAPFDEIRVYQQQKAIAVGKRAKIGQNESSPGLPARATEGTNHPVLADIYTVSGSSKTVLVGAEGLEPPTLSV